MGKPKLQPTREQNIYSYVSKGKKKYAYRYRYTRTDGKKTDAYKQNFSTMKDAALALTAVKAELLKGNYARHDHADMTMDQLFDMLLEFKEDKNKVSTHAVTINVKKRMSPLIGNMRVKDLNKYNYNKKFIEPLKKEVSPGTLTKYHSKICTAINFAVENEFIERNRLKGFRFEIDRTVEIYSEDEIRFILEYTEGKYLHNLMVFLINTGTRIGEALGLKWENVDFENRMIKIDCTRDMQGERTPKTKNSYRDIPMTQQLYTALKKYKATQKAVMLRTGSAMFNQNFDHHYVFLNTRFKPLSYLSVTQFFNRVSKNSGIHYQAHKFRHTFASILIAEGVDIATVAKLLGDTIDTVQKTYVHALDEKREEAVQKLEKVMDNI